MGRNANSSEFLNIIFKFGRPQYKIPQIKNKKFVEKYQSFRMKIDNLISYGLFGVVKRSFFLKKKKINVDEIINDGFLLIPGYFKNFAEKFQKRLDLITSVTEPKDAGAKMEFFSGKHFSDNLKSQSLSQYYSISKNDMELNDTYNFIKKEVLSEDIKYALSVLSGYMVDDDDISMGLGIVSGENSNSEWHTDVFCNTCKMFIYLCDVAEENSPFEFMIGTVNDISFRSKLDSLMLVPSARLIDENLNRAENKYKVVSCLGKIGTLILANTSGIHRKGKGNPLFKRYVLGISTVRLSIMGKLIKNIKYRFK